MPSPHRHRTRDGTLIRFWCRSEATPMAGYWSRRFLGWCACSEDVPLIRHDVTGWVLIADHAKRAPAKIRG
jgi:hypothetical protein